MNQGTETKDGEKEIKIINNQKDSRHVFGRKKRRRQEEVTGGEKPRGK